MLADESGLAAELMLLLNEEGAQIPEIPQEQIAGLNIPAEAEEKAGTASYPAVRVYCESVQNELREKFRAFSGTARLAVEVRATSDLPEDLSRKLQLYCEAVLRVINRSRGEWKPGLMYPGTWQTAFGPMKRGGRNWIQVGKIQLDVIASE